MVSTQKNIIFVCTRHVLPRLAQLADIWQEQVKLLPSSQQAQLLQNPSLSPAQRSLPNVASLLAAAARCAAEPRRVLAAEVISSTKALSEGPRQDKLSHGMEVAAVCNLVARLLSEAAAAERKEEKEQLTEALNAGTSVTERDDSGSRPGTADASPTTHSSSAKRSRGKKDVAFFSGPGETQALRDSLVAILFRLDLHRQDATAVATALVKCLEFLTRRETKRHANQALVPDETPPAPLEGPIHSEEAAFDSEATFEAAHFVEAVTAALSADDEEEEEEDEEDAEGDRKSVV